MHFAFKFQGSFFILIKKKKNYKKAFKFHRVYVLLSQTQEDTVLTTVTSNNDWKQLI